MWIVTGILVLAGAKMLFGREVEEHNQRVLDRIRRADELADKRREERARRQELLREKHSEEMSEATSAYWASLVGFDLNLHFKGMPPTAVLIAQLDRVDGDRLILSTLLPERTFEVPMRDVDGCALWEEESEEGA